MNNNATHIEHNKTLYFINVMKVCVYRDTTPSVTVAAHMKRWFCGCLLCRVFYFKYRNNNININNNKVSGHWYLRCWLLISLRTTSDPGRSGALIVASSNGLPEDQTNTIKSFIVLLFSQSLKLVYTHDHTQDCSAATHNWTPNWSPGPMVRTGVAPLLTTGP